MNVDLAEVHAAALERARRSIANELDVLQRQGWSEVTN